jgi:hypothetical protein
MKSGASPRSSYNFGLARRTEDVLPMLALEADVEGNDVSDSERLLVGLQLRPAI